MKTLTIQEARAIALAGAGFGRDVQPSNPPLASLEALGITQIDTVNVFARAHYMPAFSRYGTYPVAQLDGLMATDHPAAIEYWAHEASLIPADFYQLFEWRRREYSDKSSADGQFWAANQKLAKWIIDQIRSRGPLSVAELEHEANRSRGGWWGWSDVKRLTVMAFIRGDLIAWGRSGFTRVFDLPERHPELFSRQLGLSDQRLELLHHAAKALGVFTEADLADYYRMKRLAVGPLLQQMVEVGAIEPISVAGSNVYLHSNYANADSSDLIDDSSRQSKSPLLLSPFDPLIWHRPRLEWLWDFEYRIEIYTPEPKRKFGYYSLPLLYQNRLVGRVDLKADRKAKVLFVKSAWHEASLDGRTMTKSEIRQVAGALRGTLDEAATWQTCEKVEIEQRGNLSDYLS